VSQDYGLAEIEGIDLTGYPFQIERITDHSYVVVNRKTGATILRWAVQSSGPVSIFPDVPENGPLATVEDIEDALMASIPLAFSQTFGGKLPTPALPSPAPVSGEALVAQHEPKSSIDLKLSAKGETYWEHKRYYDESTPGSLAQAIDELAVARGLLLARFPNNVVNGAH